MKHIKNNHQNNQLPYLERIDEFEHVQIARLKGDIDQSIIPLIEARIQKNRKKEGVRIDKNIIIDYALVDAVDTAAIAFHLVRLKEFESAGRKIGFINVTKELAVLLDMFKQTSHFKVYLNEEDALNELNVPAQCTNQDK